MYKARSSALLPRPGGGGCWGHHRGAGVQGDHGLQRVHVQPPAGAQCEEPLVPRLLASTHQ